MKNPSLTEQRSVAVRSVRASEDSGEDYSQISTATTAHRQMSASWLLAVVDRREMFEMYF